MNFMSYAPMMKRNALPLDRVVDGFFKHAVSGADFSNNTPSVNVSESTDSFELELAAPGLTKESFSLSVDAQNLTIKAEKPTTEKTTAETKTYQRKEFDFASFSRTFRLSNKIDTNNIAARYENGVLYVTLPKKEEAKPQPARSIEIV